MKGLNQFLTFNFSAFGDGKTFAVTGISEYLDYNTKEHRGTSVECVIVSDNTSYKFKDGERFSNQYEKITFKVPKDVEFPLGTHVVPKNPVASIYGEYRNQLSVKCDDVVAVTQKEK